MIVEWVCETGFAGCERHGEIEVDDNATDGEISKEVMEEAMNYMDISWKIKDGERE